jgi:transcriptional regulator with XRE-family HTH domain
MATIRSLNGKGSSKNGKGSSKKREGTADRTKLREKDVVVGAGPVIRDFREELGITIEQVSAKADINKSSLSRYESGEIAVTIRVLELISKAMGVPPAQIMDKCVEAMLEQVTERYKDTKVKPLLDNLRKSVIEKS